MFGTDFDEGMNGTVCDIQSNAFMEQVSDFTIRPALASEFADQFSVGFQFGSRRFGWKIGKFSARRLLYKIRDGRRKIHGNSPEAIEIALG
jgi:hypothetical protein